MDNVRNSFLVTIVTAVATTVVVAVSDWIRQRGRAARAKRTLDDASARLNLLSTWVNLQERLGADLSSQDVRRRLDPQLHELGGIVEQGVIQVEQDPFAALLKKSVASILLLGIDGSLRLMRVLYWILLGFIVTVALPATIARMHVDRSQDWAYNLGVMAAAIFKPYPLALALFALTRWWIVHRERKLHASSVSTGRALD